MASSEYEIVYTEKCLKKIGQIEKIPPINAALEAIYVGLYKNPYAFGVVPPLTTLRFAKAEYEYKGERSRITVLFTIIEDDKLVKLVDVTLTHETGGFDLLE